MIKSNRLEYIHYLTAKRTFRLKRKIIVFFIKQIRTHKCAFFSYCFKKI